MKILGLRYSMGIPLVEMLCTFYDNKSHENHIEIARRYWKVEPTKYDVILLLLTENHLNAYTANDFRV